MKTVNTYTLNFNNGIDTKIDFVGGDDCKNSRIGMC